MQVILLMILDHLIFRHRLLLQTLARSRQLDADVVEVEQMSPSPHKARPRYGLESPGKHSTQPGPGTSKIIGGGAQPMNTIARVFRS